MRGSPACARGTSAAVAEEAGEERAHIVVARAVLFTARASRRAIGWVEFVAAVAGGRLDIVAV